MSHFLVQAKILTALSPNSCSSRYIFLFLRVRWVSSLTQSPPSPNCKGPHSWDTSLGTLWPPGGGGAGCLIDTPRSTSQEVEKSGLLNVTKIAQGGRKLR